MNDIERYTVVEDVIGYANEQGALLASKMGVKDPLKQQELGGFLLSAASNLDDMLNTYGRNTAQSVEQSLMQSTIKVLQNDAIFQTNVNRETLEAMKVNETRWSAYDAIKGIHAIRERNGVGFRHNKM